MFYISRNGYRIVIQYFRIFKATYSYSNKNAKELASIKNKSNYSTRFAIKKEMAGRILFGRRNRKKRLEKSWTKLKMKDRDESDGSSF